MAANLSVFTPPHSLKTAVLFLVFNRPDTTREVFAAIRQARPPRLYVAADGARLDRTGESERCAEVRKIATAVDWPCEVKTLFREKNLGCKVGVSTGISWFFENEEEGIILEDDCLPSQSFFWFCEELLEKYRNDKRVGQICGTAFVTESATFKRDASYLLSKYGPIWGWASWRRAWVYYDPDISSWPLMRTAEWLNSAYHGDNEKKARVLLGERLFRNEIDTWDYQWGFAKNYQSALSVTPVKNMIVNVGFGADATHTTSGNSPTQNKSDIDFPLKHPVFILADAEHDQYYSEKMWGKNTNFIRRLMSRVLTLISRKVNGA